MGIQRRQGGYGHAGERDSRGCETGPGGGHGTLDAAGEFVREEIYHVREGKHGARSAKQAVAIGLSKAARAGISLGGSKPKTTRQGAVEQGRQRSAQSGA